MLSSNEIVRFFDNQYLYKESVNFLDFFQADSDQWKGTYEGTNSSLSCQVGQSYPNFTRAGRGISGWYEGNRQVQIAQSESVVNYIPALQ